MQYSREHAKPDRVERSHDGYDLYKLRSKGLPKMKRTLSLLAICTGAILSAPLAAACDLGDPEAKAKFPLYRTVTRSKTLLR